MDQVIFYGLALITIVGALATIFSRNAMYSVLALVVTFFAMSGLYLQLKAEFVAVVHIIVYAGAIRSNVNIKWIAVLAGIAMAGILGYGAYATTLPARGDNTTENGTVKVLGKMLFNEYLLPFELTSVLLIATMVGVIVLTKKEE
jgi:NADH-quinone oxidoreductase subunit J